jgi:hypothetical protein
MEAHLPHRRVGCMINSISIRLHGGPTLYCTGSSFRCLWVQTATAISGPGLNHQRQVSNEWEQLPANSCYLISWLGWNCQDSRPVLSHLWTTTLLLAATGSRTVRPVNRTTRCSCYLKPSACKTGPSKSGSLGSWLCAWLADVECFRVPDPMPTRLISVKNSYAAERPALKCE